MQCLARHILTPSFNALLLSLCLLAVPLAHANDGVASLEAGGIVIGKTEAISMEQEDLFISQDLIKVAYVFRNVTQRDVTTRIAFPLPAIPENPETDLNIDESSDNPMNFSVKVNGKAQPFGTERKRRDEAIFITHHWEQTFPAGKTVKISHSYKPASGGMAMFYPNAEAVKQYCIEPSLRRWLEANDDTAKGKFVSSTNVDYILTTANSWRGNIGKFRLTVKKSDPEEKVSLCADGIKKVDATTFVWEQHNFQPQQDLHILWVTAQRFTP